MDSTCVLIGLQVCFHSTMKHENDVSNMVGCLQAVRFYSFMKEIKVYIYALRISSFSSFRLESLWELTIKWCTDLLSNSPKCSLRVSPGYEGTEKHVLLLNLKILRLLSSLYYPVSPSLFASLLLFPVLQFRAQVWSFPSTLVLKTNWPMLMSKHIHITHKLLAVWLKPVLNIKLTTFLGKNCKNETKVVWY